ncbi:hypothetical protein BGZ75_002329 [Mortierella antarctica]|nr:hypothetical protein BGZ75_002329 [Mortierella antarctica]
MVRLAKSLVGALVALSVVLPAAVSAQKTASAKPGPTGSPTPSSLAPAPATGTIVFNLPTAVPTPAPVAPPNGSGNQTLAGCPGPLIANTLNLKSPTCMGPCCIKCPAVESFYEPNEIHNVLKGSYITRQVSLAFSIFMALSYIILPGKRAQPHISVLMLTVSTSLWYAAFDIMPGVSNACVNDFEQSTGHNSRLCGVQGVLIIYLTQTSALWCSLLIYKLHLLAVWRSNWIDTYYAYFTGFCWVFPLAFAIPVAVKNLAQYPGIGFSCLVSTDNLNTYLFYPTAAYIFPAMLLHLVTVGKMIHLAVMSSKVESHLSHLSSDARMKITTTMQAKRLLRGQWRPALMVSSVMTALTVFWLFYFIDAHRLVNLSAATPWVGEWLKCVMASGMQGKSSDETQAFCARGARANLPSVAWFTAAEYLLATIGVVIALVFISKSEFWEEWGYLLSNLFRRGKTGNGSSRGRRTPDGGDSKSATMVNRSPDIHDRKSPGMVSAPGVFRSSSRSMSTKDSNGPNGQQWYDMDDLLDKDFDENGNRRFQRTLSSGSRTGMANNASPNPVSDLPRYNNPDTISGDLLYRPPVHEATPTHWTPSAQTLATPERSYMGANAHERYVEQPVVPSPVPRTPKMASQQIYLSNPGSPSSPPQSPTTLPGYNLSGSLSPMPPRSPTHQYHQQQQRSRPIDVVPVTGSPTYKYQQQQQQQQHQQQQHQQQQHQQQQHQQQRAAQYESSDQIMVASRESVGTMGKPTMSAFANRSETGTNSPNMRIHTNLDQRARSPPPPSVPYKNPHRQNNPGYMSPPIRVPSNGN